MRKRTRIFLVIIAVLVVGVLAGPKVKNPQYDNTLPGKINSPADAETLLFDIDKKAGEVRPGNESRIYWANDSLKKKTEYVLLSLHGYSACPEEGNPVHFGFAEYFGMNAIMPRLAEHGLVTDEPLMNMTPDGMWESAKQALVMARAMGEKIILMGTSTGGTLVLKLAAEFPENVAAVILYSPNIRIYNKAAVILTYPWGVQLGRIISKGKYRFAESTPETEPYWYIKQRVEGVVNLQKLVSTTMDEELFKRIKMPAFVGYYYKNEEFQDKTVSVEAIRWMYEELGTPANLKREVAFPEAGDHVIPCHLTSNSWEDVLSSSLTFGEEVLNLEKVTKN